MPQRIEKERNAARSRAAILDAAERLFAEQGYDATSLNEVGAAAGSPAELPATSSAARRTCIRPSSTVLRRGPRRGPGRPGPGAREQPEPRGILAGAVSDYFDFLAARPNFIRLIEREALSGARRPRASTTSPPARKRWPPSAPSSASTTPIG